MTAQIRPNRLSVSDRFPMLGFTIRTDGGETRRAEVALATDPAFFRNREGRTPETFYATSSAGVLTIEGGEAAYVVPTEVMARFVGAEKLYFALATGPAGGGALTVDVMPDADSPYVSVSGLRGRGLRRVRVFPTRGRRGASYAEPGAMLIWAGDAAKPGMQKPANGNGNEPGRANGNGIAANGAPKPANGATNGGSRATNGAAPADYDDGFGDLPPLKGAPANGSDTTGSAQVQSLARALDAGQARVGDRQRISAPPVRELGLWESTAIQGLGLATLGLAPAVTAARAAVEAFDVSIGIGPSFGAGGVGQGFNVNFGLIFAPGNRVGAYGTLEINTGTLGNIEGTAQITVLKGGIDSFRGIAFTAGFLAGAEGFVGGASAIFNDRGEFIGITVEGGLGIIPTVVEFFGSVQNSIAGQLGHAVAFAVKTPTVRALTSDNITIGQRQRTSAPDADELGWLASNAVQAALAANPVFTPIVASARAAAEAGNVSIGIGPSVSGGFIGGAQLGAGVIFAPGNKIGYYGSVEAVVGAIASISLTIQVTILRGGIASFEGIAYTASVSGGEGVVAGASAIFNDAGFLGVSFQSGVGVGLLPLEIYGSVQRGVAAQLGTTAFAMGAPAWAMIIGPEDVQDAQRYAPAWADLFNWRVPPSVASAVSGRGFSIMSIGDAHGALSLDKYEVKVDSLPSGMSAPDLLDRIRLNMNDFVDTDNTEFDPYDSSDGTKWAGSSPVGACFHLDIIGPDNAAVVGSLVESNRFRFTTIETPRSGDHPVTGHREWGYREEGGGYVFYTRGTDRATQGIGETLVFAGADHLWKSFQTKLAEFVNDNGGSASILPRFSKRFHPDVVRILYGGASAQGLGYDPLAIEVKYRMFIPSPMVASGTPGQSFMDAYGADNRGPSYDQGTSRGEVTALVHLNERMGVDRIEYLDRHWSESTEYDYDDTTAVSGKPDWWREKKAGATPKSRGTVRLTADNLKIYAGAPAARNAALMILDGENWGAVTIKASGTDPVAPPGAPAADADITVAFRYLNGLIQAKIIGTHDGFPAHEVYINGEPIYTHDPVAAGKGPLSMFGVGDTSAGTDWVTVARMYTVRVGGSGGGAQGQALGRPGRAQSRAMGEFKESFTVNWDDIQLINQPTDLSCWATAAAMVIGWRDQMSLTPATIASVGGRSLVNVLDPATVGQFAADMGLVAEPPMCWTQRGFRDLLENNGPLWVGSQPTALHVVVVTGMYNDGDQVYLRITDPWDRVVGTPGAPGGHLDTHDTGSRYIMKWEDFVEEYERAAINHAEVNLQILHSGGTGGRQPNRGGKTPPGYAQSLGRRRLPAARGLADAEAQPPAKSGAAGDGLTVTIASQRTPALSPLTSSANAVGAEPAAAWMALVGEFDPALTGTLSTIPQLASDNGWTIGIGRPGAGGTLGSGIGVTYDQSRFRYAPPQSASGAQSQDGGSPLLVTVVEGGVDSFTGWTGSRSWTASDGTRGMLLVSDAGMPVGAAMHLSPSGDLARQIVALIEAIQLAHAGAADGRAAPTKASGGNGQPTQGRSGNGRMAPEGSNGNGYRPESGDGHGEEMGPYGGYANGNGNGGSFSSNGNGNGRGNGNGGGAMVPAAAFDAPSIMPRQSGFPPPAVRILRSDNMVDGVNFSLFLLDGSVRPQLPPALVRDKIVAEPIIIDQWPYIDGPSGRSHGKVEIEWGYDGSAVANVATKAKGGAALDGWSVRVGTDIGPGPSTPTETCVKVTVTTIFTRGNEAPQSGVVEVLLKGNGQHDISYRELPALAQAS